MIAATEHPNDTLNCVDNNPSTYNTRHARFTLNQAKQLKTLRQDAGLADFDTVINNFDENVNVKCNSGFFLEVASPALLSLAKQTCDLSHVIINNVRIDCTNSRISLDNHNFLINNTFFFNLVDNTTAATGKVTVHCHTSTRTVHLQGSKITLRALLMIFPVIFAKESTKPLLGYKNT